MQGLKNVKQPSGPKSIRHLARIFLTIIIFETVPLAHGQTLQLLHSFEGSDGAVPWAGLVQGSDGNFYGTTANGGTNQIGFGTVFKVTATGELTTLVSLTETNGSGPYSGVVQGIDGNLYGTSPHGGENDNGTIFTVTTNGALTTLFKFNGSNGAGPRAGLCEGSDGYFYGSTGQGGTYGAGLIFRITHDGNFAPLISFDGTNGSGSMTSLMQASNGNFYGTTQYGGTNRFGTVFSMTMSGMLTTLAEFNRTNGYTPWGGRLVEGSDGNLYGTTLFGGEHDFGTVFKMTPTGQLTTLISFNGTNGGYPYAGLIQGSAGNFYGVTSQFRPGENIFPNRGTVFKITADGVFSTVATFNGNNGAYPWAALVQGRDGNLYGTTRQGGTNNLGTVFRIVFPSLSSRVSGHELVLSWPTNQVGFTLQAAAAFNSSTNWIDFTNLPAVVGGEFVITNSISGDAQFYRLKK